MTSPRFTPAEAAQIEAGLRTAHGRSLTAVVLEPVPTAPTLTLAQAVARINAIKPQVLAERTAAFDKMRPLGLTALAQALQLHDDGIFTAEQTLRWMRETLGLPVIAHSRELGQLQAALYQGHFHGAASEPADGDHYAAL